MSLKAAHIVAAAVLVTLLCSCRERIIPRATMVDIYSEMFLADQWLSDHYQERTKADTSLFYDPIFARYGYTFEDYDRSVKYYLKDPERFSKIFRDASARLAKKKDLYARKSERVAKIREFNDQFKGYMQANFDEDTVLWRPPITDSLILDSLRRDSLYRDSLIRAAFVLDSLRLDSLYRDSIRRHNERIDSILNAKRRQPRKLITRN